MGDAPSDDPAARGLDAALREARGHLAILQQADTRPVEERAEQMLADADLHLAYVDHHIVDDDAGPLLLARYRLRHTPSGQTRVFEFAVATEREPDQDSLLRTRAAARAGLVADLLGARFDAALAGQPTMPIPKIED